MPTHEQKSAQRAATLAIADGVLVRPRTCANRKYKILPFSCYGWCSRIQPHHEDYSRPLDVVWLCTSCHRRLHMQHRKEARKRQDAANVNQLRRYVESGDLSVDIISREADTPRGTIYNWLDGISIISPLASPRVDVFLRKAKRLAQVHAQERAESLLSGK